MIKIKQVDVNSKTQRSKFVDFHYQLYKDCQYWVPPFKNDIHMMMNPKKHPFYDHSIADFFYAERDGQVVGKIAALINQPFNAYHNSKDAEFYLFDSIDDQEVANALFSKVFEWAKQHGMDRIVGPKGFGPLDGYGIQIEGFEFRQMMNMMNYNYPYYQKLVENLGFTKEVDFVSSFMNPQKFIVPEKVKKAADIALKRGSFEVMSFKSTKELRKWALKLGQAYNKAFVSNWEYYPLTQRELDYVINNVITIVIPSLLKVILKNGEIVGFVLPFPDISSAMQKNKGSLGPVSILRILKEIKKTDLIDFNGIGILPEYQGLGGNAIIYKILSESVQSDPRFVRSEFTQVAETAVQMRKDLGNLGVKFYKNHRVYKKDL